MPCAETYHITWTCYGQWLHGDARGYVDDRHRTPGEPYAYDHPDYYNTDFNRMKEEPCWLSDEQRLRAEAAIEEACSFRGWNLMAVNVQPDHVHVAVEARETDGVRARQVLKDRSTRALKAAYPPRCKWWTEGGKVEAMRYDAQLANVIEYINEGQRHPRPVRKSPAASAAGSGGSGAGANDDMSPPRKRRVACEHDQDSLKGDAS